MLWGGKDYNQEDYVGGGRLNAKRQLASRPLPKHCTERQAPVWGW